MDLRDQVVIVTGAAGNLGAAVVAELGRRKARIICVDASRERLAALEKAADGPQLAMLDGLDLTRLDDAAKMTAAALDRFGRIDALVNTIGGFRMAPVGAEALKDWDFLMDVNARAALATTAAVIPAMLARNYGRIVHVAAGAGHRGAPNLAVYSAAKSAVMRITESIAEEHREHGITANCILPGTIDTPQNRAAMPDADASVWVTPANIAAVIAFLLSQEAGAVTGASIPVTRRV